MFLQWIISVHMLLLSAPAHGNATDTTTTEISNTTTTTTPIPVIPCNGDEWTCADGGCVKKHQQCDGVINCRDGSDEILKDCKGADRELLGIWIHCASPRCARYRGVCPGLCCRQPEFCYYALFAESGAPNSCILPDFPKNGSYSVKVEGSWGGVMDSSVRVDFSLQYRCEHGTVPVGDAVRCRNGTWSGKFPFCSDACELNKIPGYQYMCEKKNFTYPCGDFVAINSFVHVEKTAAGTSNALIYCTADRTFNTSTKCVEELETLQKKFEMETLSEIEAYETKFSKSDGRSYEFRELVTNYYEFVEYVKGNSSRLNRTTEACGIYLDLLEHEISLNKKNISLRTGLIP